MRLFDFLVFYPMANFERRRVKEFTWGGPLDRATLLAALTTSFLVFAGLEIIYFLMFKVNILDVWYTIFLFLAGSILMVQLFGYLYITKKRYEYITSSQYKSFTLNTTLGVTISFLLFVFSFLGSLGIAIVIGTVIT